MERILNASVRQKITTAEEAAAFVRDGMVVGASGFTVIGYPKDVPAAIARRADRGESLGITLITGGNVGDELEGVLARAGVLRRRYLYQSNPTTRSLVNEDKLKYVDTHVSTLPYWIKNGYPFVGKIDLAIIEVAGVDEAGNLIPGCAVGVTDLLAKYADKIILEVNDTIPCGVEGMHDVFTTERIPHTQPIPITNPSQRIGTAYVPCDPKKIVAVVCTSNEDTNTILKEPNEEMEAIAGHLIRFFEDEVRAGRLTNPLPPLQSGVGGVSNAVLQGLIKSNFEHMSVYTEVMQDAVVSLIDARKVDFACGTALTISPDKRESLYANLAQYQDKIILRNMEISNSPEVIRRLGVIAMNTALEVDLSGNVNSTHVGGCVIMNGIGGSGDYARASGLSVFSTASTAKNGTISCIVPHVGHVDHTEHDTQIIVTEQGLADLRGLTAFERAELMIEKCAHPKFRDELRAYRDRAYAEGKGRHAISRL